MGVVVKDRLSKADLLKTLRAERAKLDAVLARVPDERMEQPGAMGDWSVKDMIAHIMCYERWIAAQIATSLRSGLPVPPPGADLGDTTVRNAWYYDIENTYSLVETRARARRVFDQLVASIEASNDEQLNTPVTFGEGENLYPTTWDDEPRPVLWPLWKWIADQSYEHYPQHIPTLEAWIAAAPEGKAT